MTSKEQLADWIDTALKSPQIIEDVFYVYPCNETFRERQLRFARSFPNRPWSATIEDIALRYPIPSRNPALNPNLPVACADVLALALIGMVNNDLEAAWQTFSAFAVNNPKLFVWEMYAELIQVPERLCHTLLDWHSESAGTAHILAEKLRNNAL
jgi:hypothetical protein